MNKISKIVVLEGLPGSGKSSLLEDCRMRGAYVIEELLTQPPEAKKNASQDFYFDNDLKKQNLALDCKQGVTFIDRGPISTLAYNLVKSKISDNNELLKSINHFQQHHLQFYKMSNVNCLYLEGALRPPYSEVDDPYGSANNLRLLDKVTRQLCELFCIKTSYMNVQEATSELGVYFR